VAVADELDGELSVEEEFGSNRTAASSTDEEARFQKMAYEKAAERLKTCAGAKSCRAGFREDGFEHLVQQLYLSAMMQMAQVH